MPADHSGRRRWLKSVEGHPVIASALAAVLSAIIGAVGGFIAKDTAGAAAEKKVQTDVTILHPDSMDTVSRQTKIKGVAVGIPQGQQLWFALKGSRDHSFYYAKPWIDGNAFIGNVCLGPELQVSDAFYEILPILVTGDQGGSLERERAANGSYSTKALVPHVSAFKPVTVRRAAQGKASYC